MFLAIAKDHNVTYSSALCGIFMVNSILFFISFYKKKDVRYDGQLDNSLQDTKMTHTSTIGHRKFLFGITN